MLLRRMQDDVDQGRFSEAANLFDQHAAQAPREAALLRAWIFLKKRDYARTIKLLNAPDLGRLTRAQDAERLMLLAVAHSRSNRFAEADEYFDRAASTGAELIRSGELAYWRGRRYLEERRPQDAEPLLNEIRSAPGDKARIWADWLESGILTHQKRYLDSALVLMHLLEFMDGLKRQYREDEIWALHTLATRARELDAPKIRRFIQARVNRQEWTEDFRVNQFQTYKAVAWCHALEGDYFNAFRYLKMAGAIAPSPPWQAMTLLDKAYLAKCIGEALWSRSELAEAQEILDQVSWRETDDEERVALPLAAELCAQPDSGRAASYLARFFELRDAMSPQLHLRYDDRLSALAEYANGIVQAQLGNRKSASAAFRKAWDVYESIGYDWRAGRCALRMYELTSNASWLERAKQKLQSYTGSWLRDELREEAAAESLPVTPAQRRVLGLLTEGKTTAQIAKITGTSPNTIQNHIKAMLRALGVPSRSVLIAEAMKRGLARVKISSKARPG
jgi:DNA-binding CsgD family transcriptional regulator